MSTILFVGRLDRRKGLPTLLAAYAALRCSRDDARLVIVGDGPLRPDCERYVRQHAVPDVHFAGFVDAATLPRCYAAADVFCAPATGEESFGIVLLEAMASGVPVVASAIPGFAGVLSHGRTGLLLPAQNPAAWSRALGALLDDPARRVVMAQAGVHEAERYDWGHIAEEVLDVYAEARSRKQLGIVAADVRAQTPVKRRSSGSAVAEVYPGHK